MVLFISLSHRWIVCSDFQRRVGGAISSFYRQYFIRSFFYNPIEMKDDCLSTTWRIDLKVFWGNRWCFSRRTRYDSLFLFIPRTILLILFTMYWFVYLVQFRELWNVACQWEWPICPRLNYYYSVLDRFFKSRSRVVIFNWRELFYRRCWNYQKSENAQKQPFDGFEAKFCSIVFISLFDDLNIFLSRTAVISYRYLVLPPKSTALTGVQYWIVSFRSSFLVY